MGMIAKKRAEGGQLAAVRKADRETFAALAEEFRRELKVHCYRMLGSLHDAEDMVQDTFLRAWSNRRSFEGRSSVRGWMYRIATNACLDFLKRKERKVADETLFEVPWLQPYPDRLLEVPAAAQAADARLVSRESIELAFLVALQVLSPKQRAAVILCDVLDWSAREVADLLETSAVSVYGALHRARATLADRRTATAPHQTMRSEADSDLLRRYVEAGEQGDARAIALLLRDDVRFAMPPEPGVYVGRDVVVQWWVTGGFGSPDFGTFRCVLTRANMMPAAACYLRPPGATDYRPLGLDVLRIEEGLIAEITAFPLIPLLEAFDLPQVLPRR